MELALYESHKTAPAHELETERPEHRILLYLRAKSYSVTQCARAMGKSEAWVRNTQRQPFFKQRLTELLHDSGLDQVTSFLQLNGMDALQTLADLMNNSEDERVILAAASRLADKIVPDKLDVQRFQELPPAQLREQIKLVSEQIRLIEGQGSDSEPKPVENVESRAIAPQEPTRVSSLVKEA